MRLKIFGLIVSCLVAAPAQAEWLEASSDHFVVVADDSERDIRDFTEKLERYDAAMSKLFGRSGAKPSPSNRVTIYVVKSDSAVRKLLGTGSSRVAGFYVPRAGGSVAFVPRIESRSNEPDPSMLILMHEYAHHFLISASQFPAPLWMSEGGAEFFASAEYKKDGGMTLGRPANHRGYELYNDMGLTAEKVLTAVENDGKDDAFGAFYGKSWLLYHYLTFSEERRGQMSAYAKALATGRSLREAAVGAFGDLDALEQDLNRYLKQRRMRVIDISGEVLETGPIAVRALTDGEEEMIPVKLRSKRGVDREAALKLVADAREVAERYPGDPAVLAALAEAEFDAGFNDRAIAAADAALAIDPKRVNAYVQKGFAMFDEAEDADDRGAAYSEAVKPFVALNRIENDHPLPLIYFYRSFVERGAKPSELAIQGLSYAAQLAPFDLDLRFNLAMQELRDGNGDMARYNLIPVAYNPHGGSFADNARAYLDRLNAGEKPESIARGMGGIAIPTNAGALISVDPSDGETETGDSGSGSISE
tara:strand:- start:713 stop:2314 length:1602 start_codon:yes stop_codon:yes gene_type:complete